jgi:GATA-binding protein
VTAISLTVHHVGAAGNDDKLAFSFHDSIGGGLLRESVFSDWQDGAPRSPVENPDEMRQKDPLATQIWRLYSRTKSRLPNQERMENLTWRMMALNLRRKEREREEQARYVLFCFSH